MNPESDKFRKLMLKRQKRESRKQKNVVSEFKSEEISGHNFDDLDSVLQSLGQGKEEKKKKVKKNKSERGKAKSKKDQHINSSDDDDVEEERKTESECG